MCTDEPLYRRKDATLSLLPRTHRDQPAVGDLLQRPVLNPHNLSRTLTLRLIFARSRIRIGKDQDRAVHFDLVPQRLESKDVLDLDVDLGQVRVFIERERVGFGGARGAG